MEIFNGKEHALFLDKKIDAFVSENVEIGELDIIQIGDNAVSERYISLKEAYCLKHKIPIRTHKVPIGLANTQIIKVINEIVESDQVAGVIIQLPLPESVKKSILNRIPLEKDVDILSAKARRKFFDGDFSKLPPVVRAVEYFIKNYQIDVSKKKCVVIGNGYLIGSPVAHYLKTLGSKIEILDKEHNVQNKKIDADLVILSAGVPRLIISQNLSAGANVIDFGSSIVDDKTVGDLDASSGIDHLGAVSLSPGGMGPLVVRFLVMNHLGI